MRGDAVDGEWYALGYDGTVNGGDAVVFLLGVAGGATAVRFVLPYAVDGGVVRVSEPVRP